MKMIGYLWKLGVWSSKARRIGRYLSVLEGLVMHFMI
jgi:hypothetical protein